jgi:hypothetical protein
MVNGPLRGEGNGPIVEAIAVAAGLSSANAVTWLASASRCAQGPPSSPPLYHIMPVDPAAPMNPPWGF